jgi:predicted O-linked N-acetylglucosamine transferase (SPINDLY family)
MRTRAKHGGSIAAFLSAALSARGRGDAAAAARALGQARRIDPEHVDVLHVGGILANDAGRREEALRLLRKAVARRPSDPQFHRSLGLVAREARRFDEAIAALRAALSGFPADGEAARLLSALLADSGRLDEARLALENVPPAARDPDLEADLARLLERAGEVAAATTIFARLCLIRPRDVALLAGHGRCLTALGLAADADAVFRQAMALETPVETGAALAHDYAMLKDRNGDVDAAVDLLGAAVMLQPDEPRFRLALARVAMRSAAHVGELTWHQARLGELEPQNKRLHEFVSVNSLAVMCIDPDGESAARAGAEDGRAIAEAAVIDRPAGHSNVVDQTRTLRIGYVSADFRQHAVANFALPLIEAHDRAGFEIHGYGDMPATDSVTERFARAFDRWTLIRGVPEAEVAQRIRADGIDVLVDLMGLTAHGRPAIHVHRPAPVQVTYLGYAGTTGLACFDARLCDALTDPPGTTDALFTEPLLRLPRLFLAYRPTVDAPDPAAMPPVFRNGHVTFGSFANPAKLTRAMIAVWRHVLDAVPGSRLVLRNGLNARPCVAADLRRMFDAAGCPAARVDIAQPLRDPHDFMACYDQIDIALDTFPYGGTTTTCEALWMGVPVVTRVGRPHASRVGLSILDAVGLADLAAQTDGAYVATCRKLAADRDRLAELRRGLRDRVRASPLGDAAGLARAIEAAYRTLWGRWCEGQRL